MNIVYLDLPASSIVDEDFIEATANNTRSYERRRDSLSEQKEVLRIKLEDLKVSNQIMAPLYGGDTFLYESETFDCGLSGFKLQHFLDELNTLNISTNDITISYDTDERRYYIYVVATEANRIAVGRNIKASLEAKIAGSIDDLDRRIEQCKKSIEEEKKFALNQLASAKEQEKLSVLESCIKMQVPDAEVRRSADRYVVTIEKSIDQINVYKMDLPITFMVPLETT